MPYHISGTRHFSAEIDWKRHSFMWLIVVIVVTVVILQLFSFFFCEKVAYHY